VLGGNAGDEFYTGEAGGGGEYLRVPDDADPAKGGAPEEAAAERDEWEVRGLICILRDFDAKSAQKEERAKLEHPEGTDGQGRLAEDKWSIRYQAPGGGGDDDGKRATATTTITLTWTRTPSPAPGPTTCVIAPWNTYGRRRRIRSTQALCRR